jgi:hypothetical protein
MLLFGFTATALPGELISKFHTSLLKVADRVGNYVFARWVDERIGVDNMFRIVHTTDDIPEFLPSKAGFEHHGIFLA